MMAFIRTSYLRNEAGHSAADGKRDGTMTQRADHTAPAVGFEPGLRASGRMHHVCFFTMVVALITLFHGPLQALGTLALRDDRYTPILAIPFISVALTWFERNTLFADVSPSIAIGMSTILTALGSFYLVTYSVKPRSEYLLSLQVTTIVILITGLFIACYGKNAFLGALFPVVFLFLMVPVPDGTLNHVVNFLQRGSAETAYRLFKLAGVPVLRESAVRFALPSVTIEVAEECSGIRSSLSLFISSLVVGYVLLRSGWSRLLFSVVTIPVVIFKNAVRIVALSVLGTYVDPAYLHGRLHRYGGLPFSLLALALLAPLLLALLRAEGAWAKSVRYQRNSAA